MPAETQHEMYQALLHEDGEGRLRGKIRHDTSHIEQMPEVDLGDGGMHEAVAVLADQVMIWAHGLELSHLPAPLLPFLEDRHKSAVAMVQVTVAYTPEI
jgi:hypothetical protein